eukprot:751530-Hanusia_phi.AAC.2
MLALSLSPKLPALPVSCPSVLPPLDLLQPETSVQTVTLNSAEAADARHRYPLAFSLLAVTSRPLLLLLVPPLLPPPNFVFLTSTVPSKSLTSSRIGRGVGGGEGEGEVGKGRAREVGGRRGGEEFKWERDGERRSGKGVGVGAAGRCRNEVREGFSRDLFLRAVNVPHRNMSDQSCWRRWQNKSRGRWGEFHARRIRGKGASERGEVSNERGGASRRREETRAGGAGTRTG